MNSSITSSSLVQHFHPHLTSQLARTAAKDARVHTGRNAETTRLESRSELADIAADEIVEIARRLAAVLRDALRESRHDAEPNADGGGPGLLQRLAEELEGLRAVPAAAVWPLESNVVQNGHGGAATTDDEVNLAHGEHQRRAVREEARREAVVLDEQVLLAESLLLLPPMNQLLSSSTLGKVPHSHLPRNDRLLAHLFVRFFSWQVCLEKKKPS